MSTLEEAVQVVNAWTDVRAELEARGVKGRRQHGSECPIAVYLAGEVGSDDFCVIAPKVFAGYALGSEEWYFRPQVSEFIERFDNGEFPELRVPLDPESEREKLDALRAIGEA